MNRDNLVMEYFWKRLTKQESLDFHYRIKDEIRAALLRHFDILKKSALLEGHLPLEEKESGHRLLKKFNRITLGGDKPEWDTLYQAMNGLHNGFLDSLRKAYPGLDDTEFKICCLLYMDFSNTEIATLSGLSGRSITAKRTSVRKKLGIGRYGNIADFLKEQEKIYISEKKRRNDNFT